MSTSETRLPLWRKLDTGPENQVPHLVYVVVEVPKGSGGKYEMDQQTGALFLDRDLFTSMVYPGDYGSVPRTLSEDGDPVDALVLVSQPHYPGVVICSRPVGLIKMEDEKGQDNKVLCVPDTKVDPSFQEMQDLEDVPQPILKEIEYFFKGYKELEPKKWVKIKGWEGAERAEEYILDSVELFREKNR